MGLFKKLGKKLRGFFKRIGKGIKKGFQKFGKLMGKIGILGQIAMMFILPGIGSMMLKGLGSLTGLTATAGSAAATAGGLGTASGFVTAAAGSSSALAKSVAWTLKTAQRFANSPLLKPFKTVTGAINGFVKNTIGFVGQKLGLDRIATNTKFSKFFQDAPSKLYGKSEKSVFNELGTTITDNWKTFKTDIQQGDIFMSGDKELSLTKAYDTGLAEKVKADNLLEKGQASIIPGVPDDSLFVSASPDRALSMSEQRYLDTTKPVSDTAGLDLPDFTNPNKFDPADISTIAGDLTPKAAPKRGFFEKVGDRISDIPEDTLAYAGTIPERVGQSLLDAPGRAISNMAVQSVMGGGGRGGPYWGSTAGPVYNPGRDRAEQYAYSSAMASAGATSDMFGSDYDYFTATQADQYGDAEGGTWGNYMGRQRVA
tara:strand:+ start:479 stop:1759 length:1281 start_codon:yes stop_codon:yes gene_type:complete